MSTISHFLSPYRNRRSDAYGGSLENRARLLREILQDTKEAIGESCAIALLFSVDKLMRSPGFTSSGYGCDLIEMLAEEPDLWDISIAYERTIVPHRESKRRSIKMTMLLL